MRSSWPKVLHKIAGKSLLGHVISAISPLSPEQIAVVVAPGMETVKQAALAANSTCQMVTQHEQLGTGHAVQSAEKLLSGYKGTVLILCGDTPLLTTETISRTLAAAKSADVTVVGMRVENPTGYGRLVIGAKKRLKEIVEEKNATSAQKKIKLCNSGVIAVKGKHLFALLKDVKKNGASGEFYLTDIIALANKRKLHCQVFEADACEFLGINTCEQLAQAEQVMQNRLRRKAMEQGVTLLDPATVYFSHDTRMGHNVVVQPNVFFGAKVSIDDNVEIRAFSHIEDAIIKSGAIIGPFARIRPGSIIGEDAHVGNFVEIKKSTLKKGAKANHLSYIGDSEVGAAANIGAGTITCNYDGINKHSTIIGDGSFIGSNTSLVAPVKIGDHAVIGAGSVITEDVPNDSLALTRSPQVSKPRKTKPSPALKKQ